MGQSSSIAVPYHKSKFSDIENHLVESLNQEAKYEAQIGYDKELVQTLLLKKGGSSKLEKESITSRKELSTGELGVSPERLVEITCAAVESSNQFKSTPGETAVASTIDTEMAQSNVSPAAVARGTAASVLLKVTGEVSDESELVDSVFKPAESKKEHDKELQQARLTDKEHLGYAGYATEDITVLQHAVICKGEFFKAFLYKISDAATYNYKVLCQILHVKDLIKKEEHPMKTMTLKRILAAKEKNLETCLGHFDNAKAAALWIQKDYNLAFEIVVLHAEVEGLEAKIAQKRRELDAFPEETGHRIEAHIAAKRAESEILLARLARVKQRQREIRNNVADLQLSALTVGFRYLDRNCSGRIEPEDLPELSPVQFAQLDIDKNHCFDINEFERAMKKMQEEVKEISDEITLVQNRNQQINNEMVRVESALTITPNVRQNQLESFEVQLLEAKLECKALQEKLTRLQESVREIAKIFQQGFILDLFRLLPVPTRSRPILAAPSAKVEEEETEKYTVPLSRFVLIATPETVKAVSLPPGELVPASIQAPDILVDHDFLQETDRFKRMSDKEKQRESVLSIQKDLSTTSTETVEPSRERETMFKGAIATHKEEQTDVLRGYAPQTRVTKDKNGTTKP